MERDARGRSLALTPRQPRLAGTVTAGTSGPASAAKAQRAQRLAKIFWWEGASGGRAAERWRSIERGNVVVWNGRDRRCSVLIYRRGLQRGPRAPREFLALLGPGRKSARFKIGTLKCARVLRLGVGLIRVHTWRGEAAARAPVSECVGWAAEAGWTEGFGAKVYAASGAADAPAVGPRARDDAAVLEVTAFAVRVSDGGRRHRGCQRARARALSDRALLRASGSPAAHRRSARSPRADRGYARFLREPDTTYQSAALPSRPPRRGSVARTRPELSARGAPRTRLRAREREEAW
jgi:hypothetical protein